MGRRIDWVYDLTGTIKHIADTGCICSKCQVHNPTDQTSLEVARPKMEIASYNEYVSHTLAPVTLDDLEDAVFRFKAAGAVGDEKLVMDYTRNKIGVKIKNGDLVLNGPRPKMMRVSKHDEQMAIMAITAIALFLALIASVILGIAVW